MGFGIFKKIKDNIKKIADKFKAFLPKVHDVINGFKPFVPNLVPDKHKKKVNDLLNVIDSGAEAADEYLNHNNSKKAIDWVKHEIQTRLKL